jgi:Ca-activated chloride channel family protein
MMRLFMLFAFIGFLHTANAQQASIAKGNDFYKEGRYDLAETQYRRAGNDPVANFNLANSLIRQKKGRDAILILADLEKENDPAIRAAAFYNAGVVFSKERDLESAIAAFKASLRINPNDKNARENLQKALLELKSEQQQKTKTTESSISESQADQQLNALQEKERKLQKKLDAGKKGKSMENDW